MGFSNTKTSSMILLSVLLPVGLLATFRMAGIIPEPPTPQTITVDAVSWNMSRPSSYIILNEQVKNFYSDDIVFVDLGVNVVSYCENSPGFPGWGNDCLKIGIVATANVSDGFIYSVSVKFSRTDTSADLTIESGLYVGSPLPEAIQLLNLEIGKIFEGAYKSESYLEAKPVNKPKNILLPMVVYWVFSDLNNIDHETAVTLEVTYRAQGIHNRVIVPAILEVVRETEPKVIVIPPLGERAVIGGSLGVHDTYDSYQFFRNYTSLYLRMRMVTLSSPDSLSNFDLYLYDSLGNLIGSSAHPSPLETEFIEEAPSIYPPGYRIVKIVYKGGDSADYNLNMYYEQGVQG